MATRYVTLKDSNGDTIYPQSVIAQVANGAVTTGLLADGAVTAAKIDNDTYSITGTPAHSGGTNSFSVTRIANLVIVNIAPIWANGSAMTANTWFDIGQLPSSIYPAKEAATIGYTTNGNNGNFITATPAIITTAGKIRVKPPTVQSVLTGVDVFFVYTI